MRAVGCSLFAVLGLLISPLAACVASGGAGDPMGPLEPADDFVPVSEDLAVLPGPDAFVSSASPTVVVLITNTSLDPILESLRVSVDTQPLSPYWNPVNRTVWAFVEAPIADGSHDAAVSFQDVSLRVVDATWSFTVDTVRPDVTLDPLPPLADKRVFTVNGTVLEANLQEVRVNGYPASIDGDRFLVPVLLWPGRNELLVEALDLAGNKGLAIAEIGWLPAAPPGASYVPFVHPNASFVTKFPSDWSVELGGRLDTGLTADVVVRAPLSSVVQSSVAVVSRRVGDGMSDTLLLSIMEQALLDVGSNATLNVVSNPEIIDSSGPTIIARFSVIQTLTEGPWVFLFVTGYWSRSVGRIWLVIGAVGADSIDPDWHGLETAAAEFRVVEPPATPPSAGNPRPVIDLAFLVTVAGILFLVLFFLGSVYYRRRPQRVRRGAR